MGKKSSKGGLHIGARIWGLVLVALGVIFLVVAYNFQYNHENKGDKRYDDHVRREVVRKIPDYHPRKNTKGTKKAQQAESKLKQKINNRGY